jgi:hypothetical protein
MIGGLDLSIASNITTSLVRKLLESANEELISQDLTYYLIYITDEERKAKRELLPASFLENNNIRLLEVSSAEDAFNLVMSSIQTNYITSRIPLVMLSTQNSLSDS